MDPVASSKWFRWEWTEKAIVALLTAVLLYAAVLVAVAYRDGGTVAGFYFGPGGHLLENTIIMTDRDCASLGSWERYSRGTGRFPVSSGRGTDVNGEARTFDIDTG